ncbi:peptidoglycan editing factor PgeF [Anaerophilus nitritogenes]|uniref:peptidoglycan editing factor PgeF n=1 Tax=Anaerophilus nitritogenes TaxID=2498136 RepID=UPI00101C47EB|nr:peptidoglycan editing factor PgeF [Anaerophilus nitritogenes]
MYNFIENKNTDGVVFFTIPSFEKTKLVKHGFSSKIGGVSKGSYESLNLGFKTNDLKENVENNYKKITKALDLSIQNLVFSDQVHKDHIKIVTKKDCGKGIIKESDIKEIDALITNEKNVALTTVFADCVPIFLLDPVKKVIALAHAGWRGTALKIAKKTVEKMIQVYQTNPKDCLAAIGPSIGRCCYEVDEGVIKEFNKEFTNVDEFVFSKGNGKYMLDLWKANQSTLKEIGLLERNITISNICSMCNSEIFFSYRKDEGITGRMAAIIELE